MLNVRKRGSLSYDQRRTEQYGNIGRTSYLKSCDGVEEERLWLTPGRTAGEGSRATGYTATIGWFGLIGEGEW
jgi:hypothetical protein